MSLPADAVRINLLPAKNRLATAQAIDIIEKTVAGLKSGNFRSTRIGDPLLPPFMPLPGEPLFISVAAEVRDLTQPPEGGIPGESWDSRSGTTLLWLDSSMMLPKNTAVKLGVAPNEPRDPIALP